MHVILVVAVGVVGPESAGRFPATAAVLQIDAERVLFSVTVLHGQAHLIPPALHKAVVNRPISPTRLQEFLSLNPGERKPPGGFSMQDVGKIIGRQGMTINAIRSLLLAGSAKKGMRCTVEIVEDKA